MTNKLLTTTADYDEPGSWNRLSAGWPDIEDDIAHDMYVFANCVVSIPYGSYVLISEKGMYGAEKSQLRVHPDHIDQLRADFAAGGNPPAKESVRRRGDARKASRWWLTA